MTNFKISPQVMKIHEKQLVKDLEISLRRIKRWWL